MSWLHRVRRWAGGWPGPGRVQILPSRGYERACREAFRRVAADRVLTRCEVESRRVLMAYEWPSYG